jgi:hypothetical protein
MLLWADRSLGLLIRRNALASGSCRFLVYRPAGGAGSRIRASRDIKVINRHVAEGREPSGFYGTGRLAPFRLLDSLIPCDA